MLLWHLFDIHLVMSRLIISVLMSPEEYITCLNIDVQSAFSSSVEIWGFGDAEVSHRLCTSLLNLLNHTGCSLPLEEI